MDQKWMLILMTAVLCHKITTGACEEKVVKENEAVEISCSVSAPGSTIVWFRMVETWSMEFIAFFAFNGDLKRVDTSKPYFIASGQKNRIKLTSFNKARDSGAYCCGSQKGQDMIFGQVTWLVGEKVEVRTEAPPKTTKPLPCTTSAPCACDSEPEKGGDGETSPLLLCSPLVLGPLVGSCGLLLLLLIVTTLFCNKIRTRRCPHHYKRKPKGDQSRGLSNSIPGAYSRPRAKPPGKQMMTNRHM